MLKKDIAIIPLQSRWCGGLLLAPSNGKNSIWFDGGFQNISRNKPDIVYRRFDPFKNKVVELFWMIIPDFILFGIVAIVCVSKQCVAKES